MTGKYRIAYVVYNRTNKDTIPYFAAAVVIGPRGGYKILDEFSFEQLIEATDMPMESRLYYSRNKSKTVEKENVRFTMIKEYKTDCLVDEVRKIYNKVLFRGTELIKRDSSERVTEIGRKLDTSRFR